MAEIAVLVFLRHCHDAAVRMSRHGGCHVSQKCRSHSTCAGATGRCDAEIYNLGRSGTWRWLRAHDPSQGVSQNLRAYPCVNANDWCEDESTTPTAADSTGDPSLWNVVMQALDGDPPEPDRSSSLNKPLEHKVAGS